MNKTIQELIDRKSVRVFLNKKISKKNKELILKSAVNGPSAGNQQMYRIIDITDQKIKDKLAVLCDNQSFIAKADLVLVFCGDFRKWYDAFDSVGLKPRKVKVGDLILAIEDSLIAAENAVTAAWSLGIGSCYIGDILENKEKVKELLDLPDYVFPSTLVVFGYPTKQQLERVKPKREDLKYLVCENKYKKYSKKDLEKMFMDKHNFKTVDDYQKWLKRFYQRKYNSDFSKEMSRSVKEYLKEYK